MYHTKIDFLQSFAKLRDLLKYDALCELGLLFNLTPRDIWSLRNKVLSPDLCDPEEKPEIKNERRHNDDNTKALQSPTKGGLLGLLGLFGLWGESDYHRVSLHNASRSQSGLPERDSGSKVPRPLDRMVQGYHWDKSLLIHDNIRDVCSSL